MANPGTAVKLKRLRQRFGINAPKLSIRTHVAWYWRALAVILILSVSLALAAWMYDAGMRFAGYKSNESEREIQLLRNHVMELDAELTKLRTLTSSGESSRLIERVTLEQLASQARKLELENASLKEDLAFYEGLMPANEAGNDGGARIDHLRVEPSGVAGGYRYRMLVVNNGGRQTRELKGSLQLLVKMQRGGKDVMITLPSEKETNLENFHFEIKHFHRLEGVFSVPSGSVLKEVEARLLVDGAVRVRQSVTL